MASGYDILLKAGAAPVIGVDAPVAQAAQNATSIQLQEGSLGLLANATYHVAIVPFNDTGRSASASRFSCRTDASRHPLLLPPPIHNLRVSSLSGCRADVQWRHDELLTGPAAAADDFLITAQPLAAQAAPPTIPAVAYAPPQRNYRTTVTLPADGPWHIYVFARRAGQAIQEVSGTDILADSAPPASVTLPLTAV